jgi:DNA-directed RNA polymerase specialized sigma24 family protein
MTPSHESSGARDAFDEAVLKLVHGESSPSTQEVQALLTWLAAVLRRRFTDLPETDLEEISLDAIVKFEDGARKGKVDASRNPSGYLVRIALNAAVDRLRKVRRVALVDPADLVGMAGDYVTDDEIVARLDARADARLVRRALSTAHKAGDTTLVRVVTHLLDEIQQTGEIPSNRAAAEALGLSHTGVANALRRYRDLIDHTGRSSSALD